MQLLFAPEDGFWWNMVQFIIKKYLENVYQYLMLLYSLL
jgi:hypothetical protein